MSKSVCRDLWFYGKLRMSRRFLQGKPEVLESARCFGLLVATASLFIDSLTEMEIVVEEHGVQIKRRKIGFMVPWDDITEQVLADTTYMNAVDVAMFKQQPERP